MISTKFNETTLTVGDTVRVHTNVTEGTKTRVQIFEGIIIRFSGRGENQTFIVRRISTGGAGVERTWPVNSRTLVKIEVKKSARRVRRSKLYYLRNLTGKLATTV
ncbi:MAG: 50S ribosomal protein L19 [Candidatus Daviesbacteria bacterium]|nr:50S ribosomal protein L19 [Candidatus Daviesbacteria bacterium]